MRVAVVIIIDHYPESRLQPPLAHAQYTPYPRNQATHPSTPERDEIVGRAAGALHRGSHVGRGVAPTRKLDGELGVVGACAAPAAGGM
jgi:hypothetical protein